MGHYGTNMISYTCKKAKSTQEDPEQLQNKTVVIDGKINIDFTLKTRQCSTYTSELNGQFSYIYAYLLLGFSTDSNLIPQYVTLYTDNKSITQFLHDLHFV